MIEDNYPTNIDEFTAIINEFIASTMVSEPSTRRGTLRHLSRFVKWCRANEISDISMITSEVVETYVNRPTEMGARRRRPGWSTMRNRLAALRRMYKASRQLGYELIDPTIDVTVLYDIKIEANICGDDDIDKLRQGTPLTLFDTGYASLLALAEAGSTNSEARQVRACDVDLEEGIVFLAGNARVDERTNPLTDWGVMVMRERLSQIDANDFIVANTFGCQCSEATLSQIFKHIASYANVGRSGFNINSVRGWRAHAIYKESGSIQAAALFLGNRSLDSTVSSIGLEWRDSK